MIYIQAENFTADKGLEGRKREVCYMPVTTLEMPLTAVRKRERLNFLAKCRNL
jgi:hypothetical protein